MNPWHAPVMNVTTQGCIVTNNAPRFAHNEGDAQNHTWKWTHQLPKKKSRKHHDTNATLNEFICKHTKPSIKQKHEFERTSHKSALKIINKRNKKIHVPHANKLRLVQTHAHIVTQKEIHDVCSTPKNVLHH